MAGGCWRRLRDWQQAGVWERLHSLLDRLGGADRIDWSRVSPGSASVANTHDSRLLEPLVDAVPPIKRPRGRPRKRPEKLHADKGYDYPRCRSALTERGIKVRIARRGKDSSERLGQHRWVVERTLAWLSQYRRLTVRYERRSDIHQAFLHLGCALICLDFLS